MSRIAGLFHRDRRPVDAAILQRLIAPLRHSASDGPRFWRDGSAGLAYQCLQTSSASDEHQPAAGSPGLAVCFDGRLDNREDLAEKLSADLQADATQVSDAALVLACYRRFGESFAGHLLGDFAIILFDGQTQQLLLARDVIGIRPLYYWESTNTFVGASEIKAILAHPEVVACPDDVTLANVLVGGDPNELRRTCFRDIRRVVPGETVVVTADRLRGFRHWDFDPARQVRCASIAEYAEVLRARFEQAVRRRLRSPGNVAVTVSGGLDSSAILCQAAKLRKAGTPVAPAVGISWVFPDGSLADEKRYLKDIEALWQVEIRRLAYSSFRFVDEEKWVWQVEYPRVFWNSEHEVFSTAGAMGCTALLDGYFGDQMMDSSGHLFELARRFRWLQVRREFLALAGSMSDCSRRSLAQELLHRFLRDLAPDWLMRPVRSIRRLGDSDRSPRWYTVRLRNLAYRRSQQQRRPALRFPSKQAEICYRYFLTAHRLDVLEQINKIAAMYGIDKAYPFMDRDLVAFIMSVPSSVVNWQGISKGLFREAMLGILPESIRQRNWKADFTPLNSGAAARGYARLQKQLRSDCLAVEFGYIDPATLEPTLSAHHAKLNGERLLPIVQVNTLIGLELWLRAFFQRENCSMIGGG
ncbi:MAG: hypothetical protein LAO06_04330 [Acidobacteriia bacterium]|nr:hypothetical protein [Terriglobia bacterium]